MSKNPELLKLELEKCKKHLEKLLEAEAVYRREIEKKTYELIRSRKLLSDILDSLDVGILVVDSDMRVVHVNRKLREIFSVDDVAIGDLCWEAMMKGRGKCENPGCKLAITEGKRTEEELVMLIGGKKRIFWVRTDPLFVDDKVWGAVRSFIDITEKKLEEEYRVLSGISMHIAHTVRNAIVPVVAFLKRLKNNLPYDEKLIDLLFESTSSLLRTLKGYEDYVSIKKDLVFVKVDAFSFFTSLRNELASSVFLKRFFIESYKDKFFIEWDDLKSLGNVLFLGDAKILRLAISSLIADIVELAHGLKRDVVKIKVSVESTGSNIVVIFSFDCRIPDFLIPYLFEPWTVEEGKTFDRWGFAMAREVAIAHRGNFDIDLEENLTKCYLSIPVVVS